MILLSKCKWLEAMLGAKNTEWTETRITAQPQCQASEGPFRILMWGRRLRTGRLVSGRSKLLTCWGTESRLCLSALSFWLERGSAAEANMGLSWEGNPIPVSLTDHCPSLSMDGRRSATQVNGLCFDFGKENP